MVQWQKFPDKKQDEINAEEKDRLLELFEEMPEGQEARVRELLKQFHTVRDALRVVTENKPDYSYYHGTDHKSARKILDQGLSKEKMGRNFDASERDKNGVFLTEFPERASAWSQSDRVTNWTMDDPKAPVVLEIDPKYVDEEKLEQDMSGGLSDLLYHGSIPPEAVSTWSINPNNERKVKKCARAFEGIYEFHREMDVEDDPNVKEFEDACEMPFNRM